VDAHEAAVEAEPEENLQERRQQQQQRQRTVVRGREIRGVEREKEKVDALGEDIRRPVGERQPREAFEGRDFRRGAHAGFDR
jgi:hypothetical protein